MLLTVTHADDIILQPNPPVAGGELTISVSGVVGQVISLADPLGWWRAELPIGNKTHLTVTLPDEIPVLLVGIRLSDEVEVKHRIVIPRDADGAEPAGSLFWQAYLLSGYPAPFPVDETDQSEALSLASRASENEPEKEVAKELLWRLQAGTVEDKEAFLERLRDELADSRSGRLVVAAMHVHHQMGRIQEARVISERYKELVEPLIREESQRWAEIISARDARDRLEKIHRWIAEDPLSDYVPQCIQILAATYSALEDYRSTALFGLLSLALTPGDAMTLNGVAFAMAEGEFQLERGLTLANQAIDILANSDRLSKPEQISKVRWRDELRYARAACLDTKGWLLTKLGRWQEAADSFDAAIELERVDEFFLHKGLMFLGQGREAEARKALREGLKISGRHRRDIEAALDKLQK